MTCYSVLVLQCVRRTPEAILKQQFQIHLNEFNYSVESFNEQWDVNGDGYCQIIFNVDFTPANFDYLKKLKPSALPVSKNLSTNSIPKQFIEAHKGYYFYESSDDDARSFKIFILDTIANKAVLYYQIL
jgi:hypothetical protein